MICFNRETPGVSSTRWSASGYIREVKINDNPDPVCTFDNDTELDYVGLY